MVNDARASGRGRDRREPDQVRGAELDSMSVPRGEDLRVHDDHLDNRIMRMGVEDTNNKMIGTTVCGKDEDGDYFGEVHAVTTCDGKKRYYVLWEQDKYIESFYSYMEIRMLRAKKEPATTVPLGTRRLSVKVMTPELDASGFDLEPNYDTSDCLHLRETKRSKFTKNKRGRVSLTPYGRAESGLIPETPANDHGLDGNGDSDYDSEDDAPISSWSIRAVAYLSESLKKNTTSSYKTAMNAWNQYIAVESFSPGTLSWDPRVDNFVTKSIRAERLFMGFILFCVQVRGVSVLTAAKYKTSVKTQISTLAGVDLTYGLRWSMLSRLVDRLKKKFPHKKRERLPFLQQDIRRSFSICSLFERGYNQKQATKELKIETSRLDSMYRILSKHGVEVVRAAIAGFFFTVSRAGDGLPSVQADFDPEVDATVSDIRWASYGLSWHFKETKTGSNPEFGAKPLVEDSSCAICPVTAMYSYLKVRKKMKGYVDDNESLEPLFVSRDGSVFTTANLRDTVKACATACGHDAKLYGAHSLRIGGATAAIAAPSGSERVCMVMGYWLSSVARDYMKPGTEEVVRLAMEMMHMETTEVLSVERVRSSNSNTARAHTKSDQSKRGQKRR